MSEGIGQTTLAEDLLLLKQIDADSGRLTSAINLSIVLDDPRAYHLAALARTLDINPWHPKREDPKTPRYTTAISSAVLDAMHADMDGVMYSD